MTGRGDVIVVGGGIGGVVTALELLDRGWRVVLVDRDEAGRLGGLARESFGGVFVVGSREQRRAGIRDTPELALRDWQSVAGFGEEDLWPRRWAEAFVGRCHDDVYLWLKARGVSFFPVVHWVERGLYRPGNSVPRFHMVWGTGHGLMEALNGRLLGHAGRDRLELRFRHHVQSLVTEAGKVVGCAGTDETSGREFELRGDAVVVATGGICGSLEKLHANWYRPWGDPPAVILNGAHRYGLGELHDVVDRLGGSVTHLDLQWHYAAGVHHPRPDRERHGLSLVPPKSALWMDATGRRIGPVPLVTAYDTRFLVEQVLRTGYGYSWQILNWKIAVRELAVSGSEHNPSIREKRWLGFLRDVLLGNPRLVREFLEECEDFVAAESVEELAEKMNALAGTGLVEAPILEAEIRAYDDIIARGPKFFNDEQLRRIAHCRRYRGDRVRTCAFQPILDPRARPLVAIREHILARKSLGGIQTDLSSRVLDRSGQPIPGLFAVGEAAGFGGGGVHGKGALEGTFLATSVLTARSAAAAIAGA